MEIIRGREEGLGKGRVIPNLRYLTTLSIFSLIDSRSGSYAKANPGFIVIRDVSVTIWGANWIVGNRVAMHELIRYDLEYRRERAREKQELEE